MQTTPRISRKTGFGRALRAALIPSILAAPIGMAVPVAAQAPAGGRIQVLFLGDDGHHQPRVRAKEILPVLASHGIDMFYTDDPADLNTEELNRYHALMLYNNQPRISEEQQAALFHFVESGGGLVVLHCASASFQNSEAFIRLVGAAFKSHGTGTFSAVRVAPDHPAIRGVPTFETWDETYIHTKHNPVDRTVLEVRREGDHDEPWTWVRTYGKGRVFYTAWGHDQRTWGNEGFQALLERGTKWAAGDWALTQQLPDPVVEYVTLEMPLPSYERPPAPWNTQGEPITQGQVALPTDVSLRLTTLRPGFSAHPFAVEPMIGNIIDFAWDARGRMWAVETQDYPNVVLPDGEPGHDRILILEDTDNDGQADNVKVFAEGLNLATSLAFANGGIVVAQAPHMLFFRDTDGDDRADERITLFSGFPRNDTHGVVSNLRYGFDNQVWGSVGYNGFRGTVGSRTYERGDFGSGYFRFPGDGSELEYMARTSNNTWGVALTEENYVFGSTANRRASQYMHIPIGYYRAIGAPDGQVRNLPAIADHEDIYPNTDILQVDQFGMYTAGAAHEFYTARAFPEEYWNRVAFVAEPTGHVIGMFDVRHDGSTFVSKSEWSLLASRDHWVAPVQVKVGPDGALWVSDFYTLVAQHNPTPRFSENGPGNAYETPNRDKLHGRIYRIAWDDAPAAQPMRLDNATPQQLVAALSNDNMFWRMTAQQLLVERGQTDVVPALIALVNDQTIDGLGMNPAALHALWTLHGLGAIESNPAAQQAARNALRHPASALRRAALMTLPHDERLLNDIYDAGILPDRGSPTTVEYTVPTNILQDSDPKVLLQALLTLHDLPSSPRVQTSLADVLLAPQNARDPWIPDAVAIAGASQGQDFLLGLLDRRMPNDSVALTGVRQAVSLLTRYHAQSADPAFAVAIIERVPRTNVIVAAGILEGIAGGWPEETPPAFTAEQITALKAAAAASPPELQGAPAAGQPEAGPGNRRREPPPSFARVAERWGTPDVFGGAAN